MKKLTALVLSLIMAFTLCACSTTGPRSPSGKKGIDISKIEMDVTSGVVDGHRRVLLNYTNNTDYTICYAEMHFTEKKGITQEAKDNYFSEIKEKLDIGDEELEELKKESIACWADSNYITHPGESSKNDPLFYYNGFYYVLSLEHYDLVEPDWVGIKYIDEGKIYRLFYDFKNNTYTLRDDTEEAIQWSNSELASKTPKPDAEVMTVEFDSDTIFGFKAHGVSYDEYKSYIETAKSNGFGTVLHEYNDWIDLTDSENNRIRIEYDSDDYIMEATLYTGD